jgi:hypothetical protein
MDINKEKADAGPHTFVRIAFSYSLSINLNLIDVLKILYISRTWIACQYADYSPNYVVVNLVVFLICIIAKFPAMHRVRIFGINSTPGIDTTIEYSPKKKDN